MFFFPSLFLAVDMSRVHCVKTEERPPGVCQEDARGSNETRLRFIGQSTAYQILHAWRQDSVQHKQTPTKHSLYVNVECVIVCVPFV